MIVSREIVRVGLKRLWKVAKSSEYFFCQIIMGSPLNNNVSKGRSVNHPSLVQFCQKKPRDFCVWFEYQERKKLMPSEKFLFLDKIGLKSGVWNGY